MKIFFPVLILFSLILPRFAGAESFSLDDCVDYARRHSPALERQRLSFSNQVLAVRSARSKFDPVFTAQNAWVERTDSHVLEGSIEQTLPADLQVRASAASPQGGDGNDPMVYALRLSKTLLGGGSLLESRLPITRARLDEAISWNEVSLETRRIRLSVARIFYEVVRSQQTLRLRELQLERARRNLEITLVKEDPLDIATARLRIPESELDVLSAGRAITNALLNLKELIGMPVDRELSVRPEIDYVPRAVSWEEDARLALAEHERIRNALLDVEKAHLESRVAHGRRLPELSAQVTVRETDGGSAETRQETDTRAELVLRWPWLDRRDRAEADRRLLDLRDREAALFQAQQQLRRDIESLALRLTEAIRTVSLQEERVRVLEQQLELYQDRWENGEINILEYIRSQNNLEDARVQLVAQKTRTLELLVEYDVTVGR